MTLAGVALVWTSADFGSADSRSAAKMRSMLDARAQLTATRDGGSFSNRGHPSVEMIETVPHSATATEAQPSDLDEAT
jgi:hypothetical protein